MHDVTTLILAGGLGTRLRPIIMDRPKVLAPIHGRPYLAYLLDQLHSAGVERAIICTGYMGERVQQTFGESYRGLRLDYATESTPMGTGGALRLAVPKLGYDVAMVFNGDSFVDVDLHALRQFHLRHGSAISMVLSQVKDSRRYGMVTLSCDDRVQEFQEKGSEGGEGWINAGVYLMQRSVLESAPTDTPSSLERDILPRYLGAGLMGFRCHGKFLDIGTPDSYAEASAFFAPGNDLKYT